MSTDTNNAGQPGGWEGNHPSAFECSKEGCDSKEMNIILASGDPSHPVAICKKCGRCNLSCGERDKPYRSHVEELEE